MKRIPLYCFLFVLFMASCRQDGIEEEEAVTQEKDISEARQYFEQEIDKEVVGSSSQRNAGKGLFRRDLLKSLNWGQAYIREITTGEAIFIPITYEKDYYTPKGDYSIALNQMSYITMYRDAANAFQLEVVLTFLTQLF